MTLFTLVYPLVGLEAAASKGQPVASTATEVKAKVALVEAYSGHNFVTALGVAFFQRELTYQPSYPWGRVLAWVQLLLTYTLVALFLLAVRRQVRR